ncbi:tagaturonate epimerase family protein [Poriferisphaera sp. WC338]|uniref:tagaturonate epimerase family protein n=1 Tax=Poriferisphaera sp. WC338 TaxID=3425129 RepID=UPI003D814E98
MQPQILGLAPSFGFGDRLGMATQGHVAALKEAGAGIKGIFAQQSIREMTRTSRSAETVMRDARVGLKKAGYSDIWGADADHLKTKDDVDLTVAAGFVFFTIDPSDHVDQKADRYVKEELAARFEVIRDEVSWIEAYVDKTIEICDGVDIKFDDESVMRAAVKYGRAINVAIELGQYIVEQSKKAGRACELEVSVDETDQPTTWVEHYIIAERLMKSGLPVVSLAPRFIGELEKGVDYKGDLAALEESMRGHAAIAKRLGPYKLSLHSGSDKVSIYPLLNRTTEGMFHVKTAGTSFLEALRVVAIHSPNDFRQIVRFAREHYETDRATYHVSATLKSVQPEDEISDNHELASEYLEHWENVPDLKGFTKPGRQILHCTFGSILTDPDLGRVVKQILDEHQDTYCEVLREHFVRHLEALNKS